MINFKRIYALVARTGQSRALSSRLIYLFKRTKNVSDVQGSDYQQDQPAYFRNAKRSAVKQETNNEQASQALKKKNQMQNFSKQRLPKDLQADQYQEAMMLGRKKNHNGSALKKQQAIKSGKPAASTPKEVQMLQKFKKEDIDELKKVVDQSVNQQLALSYLSFKKNQNQISFLILLVKIFMNLEEVDSHRQVLSALVSELVQYDQINFFLLKAEPKELLFSFLSTFQQQIFDILDKRQFNFSRSIRFYVKYLERISQFQQEQSQLSDFLKRYLELISRKMTLCDLSSTENIEALNMFFDYLKHNHITDRLYQFLSALGEQLPFFNFEALRMCFMPVLKIGRIYYHLKPSQIKEFIKTLSFHILSIADECQPQEILSIFKFMGKLNDKYYQTFDLRDQMLSTLIQAIMSKKNQKKRLKSFNLCFLKECIKSMGGRVVIKGESDRQAFFEYMFLEISQFKQLSAEELFQELNELKQLVFLLVALQIVNLNTCKAQFKHLFKVLQDLTSNRKEISAHPILPFLQQELDKYGEGYLLKDINILSKLSPEKLYSKLSLAVDQKQTAIVQTIVGIMLQIGKGHNYFFASKVTRFMEASNIFKKGLIYLYECNNLQMLRDLFGRQFRKKSEGFNFNTDLFSFLKFQCKIDMDIVWSQIYRAWIEYFNEEISSQKGKAISRLFTMLIRFQGKHLKQLHMLNNVGFYYALALIERSIYSDPIEAQIKVNFYNLIDYLLQQQRCQRLLDSLFSNIIIWMKINEEEPVFKKIGNFDQLYLKIVKAQLKLPCSPQRMKQIFTNAMINKTLQLSQLEQRIVLLYSKEGIADRKLMPIQKENILLLLLDKQKYSPEHKPKIDQLLEDCNGQELCYLLSSPISGLLSVKQLQKIFQLLNEKGDNFKHYPWNFVIDLINSKELKNVLGESLSIFIRKIVYYYTKEPTYLNVELFKALTKVLIEYKLLYHEDLIQPFFTAVYPIILTQLPEAALEQKTTFFRPFLLAGYNMQPQHLWNLIKPLSRFAYTYLILFEYEQQLNTQQFTFLLQRFFQFRSQYLYLNQPKQNAEISEYLSLKYPTLSKRFLKLHQNLDINAKSQCLIEFNQTAFYAKMRQEYEGIISQDRFFIEYNNNIIVILEPPYAKLLKKFVNKYFALLWEDQQKPVHYFTLNGNDLQNINKTIQAIALQFQLKKKDKPSDEGDKNLEFQLKLASQIAKFEQKQEHSSQSGMKTP